MGREDWTRLAIHLPWGFMGAALCLPDRAIGITATALMIGYEAFNDWRKKDKSYKDVLGIVWGFLIASFAFWIAGLL